MSDGHYMGINLCLTLNNWEKRERKKDVDVLIFFDRLAEKIREDTSSIEAIWMKCEGGIITIWVIRKVTHNHYRKWFRWSSYNPDPPHSHQINTNKRSESKDSSVFLQYISTQTRGIYVQWNQKYYSDLFLQ